MAPADSRGNVRPERDDDDRDDLPSREPEQQLMQFVLSLMSERSLVTASPLRSRESSESELYRPDGSRLSRTGLVSESGLVISRRFGENGRVEYCIGPANGPPVARVESTVNPRGGGQTLELFSRDSRTAHMVVVRRLNEHGDGTVEIRFPSESDNTHRQIIGIEGGRLAAFFGTYTVPGSSGEPTSWGIRCRVNDGLVDPSRRGSIEAIEFRVVRPGEPPGEYRPAPAELASILRPSILADVLRVLPNANRAQLFPDEITGAGRAGVAQQALQDFSALLERLREGIVGGPQLPVPDGAPSESFVSHLSDAAGEPMAPAGEPAALNVVLDRLIDNPGTVLEPSVMRDLCAHLLPGTDSSTVDAGALITELASIANGSGPNAERALRALIALSLVGDNDNEPLQQWGTAASNAVNGVVAREDRYPLLQQEIDRRFDTTTLSGINGLIGLMERYPQIGERLLGVLATARNNNGDGALDRSPAVLAAFEASLAAEPLSALRAVASPGESLNRVVARILPSLSSQQRDELRSHFTAGLMNNSATLDHRADMLDCLVALGPSALDNSADFGRHLSECFGAMFSGTVPESLRERLTQSQQRMMSLLLDSNSAAHQGHALDWMARRVRDGASVNSHVVERAMALAGSDTPISAVSFLLSLVGRTEDAAAAQLIRERLQQVCRSSEAALFALCRTIAREEDSVDVARQIVLRLSAETPASFARTLTGLVEQVDSTRQQRNLFQTLSELASSNPTLATQTLVNAFRNDASSSALNALVRLVASNNDRVSSAGLTEIRALSNDASAREAVLNAALVQYSATGSERLVPVLVGLTRGSAQFLPDFEAALTELRTAAPTDAASLRLLTHLSTSDSHAGRIAASHLQQVASANREQLEAVFGEVSRTMAGDLGREVLNSPLMSLYVNLARNRASAPLVTGAALRQNMLELVDEMARWPRNDHNSRAVYSSFARIMGNIAGSQAADERQRISDFVSFSPARVAPPERSGLRDARSAAGDGSAGRFANGSRLGSEIGVTRDDRGRITQVITSSGARREFVWGPQGFVTAIRESTGVQFVSEDGKNYRMVPGNAMSPRIAGSLSIDSSGRYSFTADDGAHIDREVSGDIRVFDSLDRLRTTTRTDGASITWNEYGQITETRSATGQTRAFSYESTTSRSPIRIVEPDGSIISRTGERVWSVLGAVGRVRNGEYTLRQDGTLVFRDRDRSQIVESMDGSQVRSDAQLRTVSIRTAAGSAMQLGYRGEETEPSHLSLNGSQVYVRPVGAPPDAPWRREGGNPPWTGRISVRSDGSVTMIGSDRSQTTIQPDGWVETSDAPGNRYSTRLNSDGTEITRNAAGEVSALRGANRHCQFGYRNGQLSYVRDGANEWINEVGQTWRHSRTGEERVGTMLVEPDGTYSFTFAAGRQQVRYNADGSVVTRDHAGLITEVVTATNRRFGFEYASGNANPRAFINDEGRWTTGDGGATWSLEGASPARTQRFSLAVNQLDGSFMQTMSDTRARNVFARSGQFQTVDAAGRVTYNEIPGGSRTRIEYDESGSQRVHEQRSNGVVLESTYQIVGGERRLQRLSTSNAAGLRREYEFDTSVASNPPRPIAYREGTQAWWRRAAGEAGHVFRQDGTTLVRTGAVSVDFNGDFIQSNPQESVTVRATGFREIVTTSPQLTSRIYDPAGRLVQTTNYVGLRRRFEYSGGELTSISEYDGTDTRTLRRSVHDGNRHAWSGDGVGGQREVRVGRYELDQQTGALTLSDSTGGGRTIEYLTRPSVRIDPAQLREVAIAIHEQIHSRGQLDNANAIVDLIQHLTLEQRRQLETEYGRYYQENLRDSLREVGFRPELRARIISFFDRSNDQVDLAGTVHVALTEIGNRSSGLWNRSVQTCTTEIRDVLWRLNSDQLAQLDSQYRQRYGRGLQESILERITLPTDRAVMLALLNRQPNGAIDFAAILEMGLERGRPDFVREALVFSNQEFRDRFRANGGERRIRERFSSVAPQDYAFADAMGVGAVAAAPLLSGGGDSTVVRHLIDNARYGALAESSTIAGNTSLLGDNERAIETALNGMSAERRGLYRVGLALSPGGITPERLLEQFPAIRSMTEAQRTTYVALARAFYADMEASMQRAAGRGSETGRTELAHWRDLILHPGTADRQAGSLVSRLTIHCGDIYNSNAQDVLSTIENMSQADWEYMRAMPAAEREQMLSRVNEVLLIIRPEVADLAMTLVRDKLAAETWQSAQERGRRSVVDVLAHNPDGSRAGRTAIFEALSRMTPTERERVKTDAEYRANLRESLLRALGSAPGTRPYATRLIDGVLERVRQGGPAAFSPTDRALQGMLEITQARRNNPYSSPAVPVSCMNDIARMLTDAAVRQHYAGNPTARAELERLLSSLAGSQSNRANFVAPLMRMIQDGHLPHTALSHFGGSGLSSLSENIGRLSRAGRDELLNNAASFSAAFGHLTEPQQQIMRSVLRNGGQLKPEDRARAFVVNWDIDRNQITQVLQSLSSVERERLVNGYYSVYGGVLSVDLRRELGGAQAESLLARNETPERQIQRMLSGYYQSSDGIGSGVVAALWDGTPGQARAAADRLIALHAEANRNFRALRDNLEFQQAVRNLNDAIQMVRESKEGAAQAVDSAVMSLVGIAGASLTGGSSLYLVYAALAGAAVKVGLNMAIVGADYNARERALTDILTGGLEASINFLGPSHLTRLFGLTSRSANEAASSTISSFGPSLFNSGAGMSLQRGLSRELAHTVASGGSEVGLPTLRTLARESLLPAHQTAENVERLALVLQRQVRVALAAEMASTARTIAREVALHSASGATAGGLSTLAGGGVAAATGHGHLWDPHASFEDNMQRLLQSAGASALLGGAQAGSFHMALRGARSLGGGRATAHDGCTGDGVGAPMVGGGSATERIHLSRTEAPMRVREDGQTVTRSVPVEVRTGRVDGVDVSVLTPEAGIDRLFSREVRIGDSTVRLRRGPDRTWFYSEGRPEASQVKLHITGINAADMVRLQRHLLPFLEELRARGEVGAYKTFDPNYLDPSWHLNRDRAGMSVEQALQGSKAFTIYLPAHRAREVSALLDNFLTERGLGLDPTIRTGTVGDSSRMLTTSRRVCIERDQWGFGTSREGQAGALLDAALESRIKERVDWTVGDTRSKLREIERLAGMEPGQLSVTSEGRLIFLVSHERASSGNLCYVSEASASNIPGHRTGRPALYALYEHFGLDPAAVHIESGGAAPARLDPAMLRRIFGP